MPTWASGNDELARTLREVKQLAHSRAVAVANLTSERVSARQSLSDNFNKGVINKIITVSRGAYVLKIVALAIALVALVVAIATFVSVNPILRLFREAMAANLFNKLLRYTYTDRTEAAANQVKVVSAIKRKQKRVKYRFRLTRKQTLETLKTQITLILHSTGMASLDYGPQQITESINGSLRRGLLITDIVKSTTTKCDCSLNDDIKVSITNLWPTAPILSTTTEQVDTDATLTTS